MSSSGKAAAAPGTLPDLRHELRELEDLFRTLSGRQVAEVTPQGGLLRFSLGSPVALSLGSHFDRTNGIGKLRRLRDGSGLCVDRGRRTFAVDRADLLAAQAVGEVDGDD